MDFMLNLQTAKKYVTPPPNTRTVTFKKGTATTQAIMSETVAMYEEYKAQVKELAPLLRGNTVLQTLKNVFYFVKNNIKYVADRIDSMQPKSPAATIYSGFADCKSYSILIAALLYWLGIPFSFRFAGYEYYDKGELVKDKNPTHVYIVTPFAILDACMHTFDYEQPFIIKTDMAGTEIMRINGIRGGVDTEYFSHVMGCNCDRGTRIGVNGYIEDVPLAYGTKIASTGKPTFWEKVDGVVDVINTGVGTVKQVLDIFVKPKVPVDGVETVDTSVVIIPPTNTPAPQPKSNNMMLWYLLGGGAALWAVTSMNQPKPTKKRSGR